MDEWACDDEYATRRSSGVPSAVARSRAASTAHSDALDALSWMTPPPGPGASIRKWAGRSSSSTSQSSTRLSSSVQAGLVAQSIPWTPNPLDSRSPRTDAGEELAGKNPKKPGCCHWVRPGTMWASTSASTASTDSGSSGGWAASAARTSPGSTGATTGRSSRLTR